MKEEEILQVKEATSIVELIGRHVALKQRGKEHIGLCPFHDDSHPSMSVNPAKGIYKCFVCGAGGDVIKFVQMYEHLSFPESVRVLADRAGISIYTSPEDRRKDELYNVLEKAVEVYQNTLLRNEEMMKYVAGRGIKEETIHKFGLGYSPDNWDFITGMTRAGTRELEEVGLIASSEKSRRGYYDRFRNRLMFPIFDAAGRVIGFGGRNMGPDEDSKGDKIPKFLNSPSTTLFDKSNVLYGMNFAASAVGNAKRIAVVEGYWDVVIPHQEGLEYIVGQIGTALTSNNINTINRRFPGVEIVLCYDGDDAGRRAAIKSSEDLLGIGNTRVCILPAGKDPDEIILEEGKNGLEGRFDLADPLSKFYINAKSAGRDLKNAEGRASFLREISPIFRQIPSQEVGVYLETLSQQTGISSEIVEAAVFPETPGHRGVGFPRRFWEETLLAGLASFPASLKFFSKYADSSTFTGVRGIVYRTLNEMYAGTDPTQKPSKPQYEFYERVISEAAERGIEIKSEEIDKMLAPRGRTDTTKMQTALAMIWWWQSHSEVFNAAKGGKSLHELGRIFNELEERLRE